MKAIRLCMCVFLCMGILPMAEAADISRHAASLKGPSGLVNTASAFGLKQHEGNVGLWGDLARDPDHDLYLLYGVRDWLEVGVESDLPYHTTPSFLFKINSQAQDRLFKGFPILAFGIYRSTSYLAASYKILPLMLNVGTTIARESNPYFYGASLQLGRNLLLQFDSIGKDFGLALRGQVHSFQFSLVVDGHTGQKLTDASLLWGVAFHF